MTQQQMSQTPGQIQHSPKLPKMLTSQISSAEPCRSKSLIVSELRGKTNNTDNSGGVLVLYVCTLLTAKHQ